ncbi:MAG: hypothetical protein H7329_20320, partial [Opitutaceae bacterium]|nr:hypothetical protein [Cytophagales bacterium]
MKKRLIIFFVCFASLFNLALGQSTSNIQTIFSYVTESRWDDLRDFFKSQEEYKRFLASVFTAKGSSYDFAPLILKSVNQNQGQFLNQLTSEPLTIVLQIDTTSGKSVIKQFEIKKNVSQQRLESAPYNYAVLPSKSIDLVKYIQDFKDEFNESEPLSPEELPQEALYRQINFKPLKLEFSYCKKILFFNKCGKSTYTKEFGPVLSDKDLPGNEDGKYERQIMEDIIDLTAFKSLLTPGLYNPSQGGLYQYVLTSVIIDGQDLVIFREGLNPWRYGDKNSDIHFINPVAVKALGKYLYVLEKGDENSLPKIQILEVFNQMVPNTENGDFGVNYIGTIDASHISGLQLINPVDIGGYLTTTEAYLLVADDNGLSQIKLNKSSGKFDNYVKTFPSLDSPSSTDIPPFNLRDVIRIDARDLENASDLGCIIIVSKNSEIVTMTSAALSSNVPTYFIRNNIKLCDVSNLGYMEAEKKWYLTDYGGKLHKLDKEGRYLGGGGTFGTSEWDNELYYPNAITPNPIGNDTTNDFRYRFMVANKWGYSTGIKLFSPGIFISKLKAFENLNSGDLTFAFIMSGKWGYIEGAKSIQMQSISINGTILMDTQWNTQIDGNVQANKNTEFLNHFPETITLNPFTINNYGGSPLALKRGWNTFTVTIQVKKTLDGISADEFVSKTIDFYWLPSSFTPMAFNSIADIRLNNSTSPADGLSSRDYIYKPIVIGTKGVFYDSFGHPVNISDYGNLQLEPGATFFNRSQLSSGLGNIHFKDNGKLTLKAGAYICASGSGTDNGYDHVDLITNLAFDPGYKKGINPAIVSKFNSFEQATCKSACEFLSDVSPIVTFTAKVDLSKNNPFKVTVNPAGTTYFNKLKWEVEEVGNTIKKGLFIIDASAATQIINLNEKITYNGAPYQFFSCKDYKITLSTGCNNSDGAIDWISTSTQTIGIYQEVKAGPDQEACDYSGSLQMTGFTPLSLAGDSSLDAWSGPTGVTINNDGLVTLGSYPSSMKNIPQT